MHLDELWLTDYRNYTNLHLQFEAAGLTIIHGGNGQGKSNLIEAIAYACSLRSFRGATADVLIRTDADKAIVRASGERSGRPLLIESEIAPGGRNRNSINRQRVRQNRELSESLRVTVFSPDDLDIVKGSPARRRQYLDELFADTDLRSAALLRDFERVVRQRNTLLRQSRGRPNAEILSTLDVWDAKLATVGEQITVLREELIRRLMPHISQAYATLAPVGELSCLDARLSASWRQTEGGLGLAGALAQSRSVDLARGVTTVGPQRDEIALSLNRVPVRTHASQGEQRTFALALRLAGHMLMTELAGTPPILLLDDVLSELDEYRSEALLNGIHSGQIFLTTAMPVRIAHRSVAFIEVDGGNATDRTCSLLGGELTGGRVPNHGVEV